MKRNKFISVLGISFLAIPAFGMNDMPESETIFFKDDGKIPNSKYPLLHYKNVFDTRGGEGAFWLEQRFAANNWTNSWRNGVYSFHHYHSTAHEVLGIYSGKALLHLGGEKGKKVDVQAGDVIVIPAGVGHKNPGGENLAVVGAYADGRNWDLLRGEPGERPQANKNIAAVPFPGQDPLLGKNEGLRKIWKK
ncbi:MAG TPA: cupin domain-containing protein [Sunxiuqinia sp.]|nr:cupin domain-containing protein [Sunxiuqinia sp.]